MGSAARLTGQGWPETEQPPSTTSHAFASPVAKCSKWEGRRAGQEHPQPEQKHKPRELCPRPGVVAAGTAVCPSVCPSVGTRGRSSDSPGAPALWSDVLRQHRGWVAGRTVTSASQVKCPLPRRVSCITTKHFHLPQAISFYSIP